MQPPPEVPIVETANVKRDKLKDKRLLGRQRLQIPLGAETIPVGLGIPDV